MQFDPQTIKSLIQDLRSKNKSTHGKARDSLLSLGEKAVKPLVEALSDPNEKVRWGASKLLDEIGVSWAGHADAETINALIADLASKDGMVRVRARQSLAAIGKRAVSGLEDALKSKSEVQRWEAAKALGQIGDAAAVEVLVGALEDEVFDVRWLAGEGLILIGRPALIPLLKRLQKRPDSLWLREGAHRVFHGIENQSILAILKPVLNALEGVEAELEVPFAAKNALTKLGK